MTTKCGFVAVIGAPNAGKSTLVNALTGAKVSIVSHKAQTTRTRVLGIAMHEDAQIILIDTPGLFKAQKNFDRAMVQAARDGMDNADFLALLVDVSNPESLARAQDLVKILPDKTKILILNKIDKVQRDILLRLSADLNALSDFKATFMVSALKNQGLKDLLDYCAAHLPEGPFHFPEDQISDMPMRLLAAEITREKLFERLHQELPYGMTVETEAFETFDNGDIKISQVIITNRDNHKPIILGKGGQTIRAIGTKARLELEEILECKVHLKLFVKVKPGWQDDPEIYKMFK